MIAKNVITAARDLHMGFDPNSHPDAGAVRFLSGYMTELMGKALMRYPSLWSDEQEVALPLATFAAGAALDSPFFLDDVVGQVGTGQDPIRIVPYEHRHDNGLPGRFVYTVNGMLFLSGVAGDWSPYESLVVRYAKVPTALVADTGTIPLPDNAEMALRYALAHFWSGRGSQRQDVEAPSSRYFESQHMKAEDSFLESLWLLRSAAPRFIRDVGD